VFFVFFCLVFFSLNLVVLIAVLINFFQTIALVGQAAQAVGDSVKSKGMCAICVFGKSLFVLKS